MFRKYRASSPSQRVELLTEIKSLITLVSLKGKNKKRHFLRLFSCQEKRKGSGFRKKRTPLFQNIPAQFELNAVTEPEHEIFHQAIKGGYFFFQFGIGLGVMRVEPMLAGKSKDIVIADLGLSQRIFP